MAAPPPPSPPSPRSLALVAREAAHRRLYNEKSAQLRQAQENLQVVTRQQLKKKEPKARDNYGHSLTALSELMREMLEQDIIPTSLVISIQCLKTQLLRHLHCRHELASMDKIATSPQRFMALYQAATQVSEKWLREERMSSYRLEPSTLLFEQGLTAQLLESISPFALQNDILPLGNVIPWLEHQQQKREEAAAAAAVAPGATAPRRAEADENAEKKDATLVITPPRTCAEKSPPPAHQPRSQQQETKKFALVPSPKTNKKKQPKRNPPRPAAAPIPENDETNFPTLAATAQKPTQTAWVTPKKRGRKPPEKTSQEQANMSTSNKNKFANLPKEEEEDEKQEASAEVQDKKKQTPEVRDKKKQTPEVSSKIIAAITQNKSRADVMLAELKLARESVEREDALIAAAASAKAPHDAAPESPSATEPDDEGEEVAC